MIKTAYANLHFVIETLTPGVVYGFKVQARNAHGLSELSDEFSILCAFVPDSPAAPTTTAHDDDFTVSWLEPYNSGSPVTGYKVYLRASSGSYLLEEIYCVDQADMVANR